ncbi:MAG: hypothetical protein F6J98_04910 [Moorea sp. SIO4G2]|uniref:hypothetical protein n=1 Tax=unclassified Moorena TaxID=2683338 RepID=UPI0013F9457B|nr:MULTISPECIES: hypothetical protein [unclassified Moorena]NEO15514.1 hypothetical protein [Moorena sp. SIO3E8]NEO59783.1 hypothetical protein [Moorena sp. SIO4G2]NEQ01927.1 hypothetical protein [Moorena sp. SIO3F7]
MTLIYSVDHTYEIKLIFLALLPTPDSRLPTPDSRLQLTQDEVSDPIENCYI